MEKMALEDFKAELDKLNRDLVILTARRNEFRPDASKDVEEELGGVWSKKKFQKKAEEQAPDVRFYNRWRLKVVADKNFHVIARLFVVSPKSIFIESYKRLLDEAIKLSVEPQRRSSWNIFNWFGRKERTVKDVEAELEGMRKAAQSSIDSELVSISLAAVE